MSTRVILGVVPGSGEGAIVLGASLRLLDQCVQSWGLPLEALPFPEEATAPREGWRGVILAPGAVVGPWLAHLEGPVSVLVPFQTPGAPEHLSWLIWPHEETSRFAVGARTLAESRIETFVLSGDSVRAATHLAHQLAQESAGAAPVWVHSGWGDLEDFALSTAQGSSDGRLAVQSFENAVSTSTGQTRQIWLGIGRTALPMARILRSHCWLAMSQNSGRFVAQAVSLSGTVLLTAQILDRSGFLAEGRKLMGLWQDVLKAGHSAMPPDEVILASLTGMIR